MDDVVVLADESAPEVQAQEALQEQQEKMIPASRVEELIKKAKLKGRDAMQDELEALRAENSELKSGGGSMGGMAAPIDVDALRKEILGDFRNQLQQDEESRVQAELEQEAQKMADDYKARMSSGKDYHEDFDEIMADFNPASFPNLVYLATQTENTPSVMYELMKNPSKLATIAVLSKEDPKLAQRQINQLSASIKANEQAKAAEKEVQSPLSRMQSSPAGRDNGDTSIADYKRMFRG
jgi:hypothetical protein